MICKRFLISGRVQGVYYRANAREQALLLGLRGWVRNLDDGRVECLACGDAEKLKQFEAWLWRGPARAQVEQVEASAAQADADQKDFLITG